MLCHQINGDDLRYRRKKDQGSHSFMQLGYVNIDICPCMHLAIIIAVIVKSSSFNEIYTYSFEF